MTIMHELTHAIDQNAADYNMFLPNIPGLAAAIFTTVTCYALSSIQVGSS
jgi:hypothetical protein